MINKNTLGVAAAMVMVMVLGTIPALAQTTTRPLLRTGAASTTVLQRITQISDRGNREITQRIDALNTLISAHRKHEKCFEQRKKRFSDSDTE